MEGGLWKEGCGGGGVVVESDGRKMQMKKTRMPSRSSR